MGIRMGREWKAFGNDDEVNGACCGEWIVGVEGEHDEWSGEAGRKMKGEWSENGEESEQ